MPEFPYNNVHPLNDLLFDDLARSAKSLIQWASPLLSPAELEASRAAADNFIDGPGPVLQAELERTRAESADIFELFHYWEGVYLKQRDPLPVNVNPFYTFDPSAIPKETDPCRLAARMALAAASFCIDLDRGEAPIDRLRGEPLCMAGYAKLFRTSRVAALVRDRVTVGSPDSLEGRCALVLVGGCPALLELISEDGQLRDVDEVASCLRTLVNESKEPDPNPIGLLTCLHRDDAAWARGILVQEPENKRTLARLEGTLFALCLDEACPQTLEDMSRRFLFDEGKNRWFEKCFQIMVTADGQCGLNFEHSGRDGTHVGRLVSEMLERSTSLGRGVTGMGKAFPLTFVRSDSLVRVLNRAHDCAKALRQSLQQRPFVLDLFGREAIKTCGLSPDSFIQCAMLVSQRSLWTQWRSVYESVQIRRFRGGRTEVTRPLTPQAKKFAEAFLEGCEAQTCLELLRQAGEAHKKRISTCLAGEGPERHLAMLRRIWQDRGWDLGLPREPELYRTPAWWRLTSNSVSSSTTVGAGLQLAGYGPVEPGGLGVRYLTRSDRLIFHVGSWAKDGSLGTNFVQVLEQTLRTMGNMFLQKR